MAATIRKDEGAMMMNFTLPSRQVQFKIEGLDLPAMSRGSKRAKIWVFHVQIFLVCERDRNGAVTDIESFTIGTAKHARQALAVKDER